MLAAVALFYGALEARLGRKRLFAISAVACAGLQLIDVLLGTTVGGFIGGLAGFMGLIGGGAAIVTRVLYRHAWQPAVAMAVVGGGAIVGDLIGSVLFHSPQWPS